MGCVCSLCFYPLGKIVYVIERLASCCVMAALISCIIATLTIMLGVGVGLGYNYCFVDFKIYEATTITSTESTTTTNNTWLRDDVIDHEEQLKSPDNVQRSKRVSKAITAPVRPTTIVVPFKDHGDLMLLISKIKESRKNITLELITR